MKVFPVDSLITSVGADGLPVYDRPYNSSDLREVYETFFSNGVFMTDPDSLRVRENGGMKIVIGAGKCHIKGAVGYEKDNRTMSLPGADPQFDKIVTVVARLNLNKNARSCELFVKNGTPALNPKAPELQRDATIYELGLADVFIPAMTTAISQQHITDTRLNNTRCGAVVPFTPIDTTKVVQQIESQVNSNISVIQSAIDKTTAGKLSTYKTEGNALIMPSLEAMGQPTVTNEITSLHTQIGSDVVDLKFKDDNVFPAESQGGTATAQDGGYIYINLSKDKDIFSLGGSAYYYVASTAWSNAVKCPGLESSGDWWNKTNLQVKKPAEAIRIGGGAFSSNVANITPSNIGNSDIAVGTDGYIYINSMSEAPTNMDESIIVIFTNRVVRIP